MQRDCSDTLGHAQRKPGGQEADGAQPSVLSADLCKRRSGLDRPGSAAGRSAGGWQWQPTDSPDIWCTRLPSHWRANKLLKQAFLVKLSSAAANGSKVVIMAGNDENDCAELRGNISHIKDGTAKFGDLRFIGRSGRGKMFDLTITVETSPRRIATYRSAIKITADGPRGSRNKDKLQMAQDLSLLEPDAMKGISTFGLAYPRSMLHPVPAQMLQAAAHGRSRQQPLWNRAPCFIGRETTDAGLAQTSDASTPDRRQPSSSLGLQSQDARQFQWQQSLLYTRQENIKCMSSVSRYSAPQPCVSTSRFDGNLRQVPDVSEACCTVTSCKVLPVTPGTMHNLPTFAVKQPVTSLTTAAADFSVTPAQTALHGPGLGHLWPLPMACAMPSSHVAVNESASSLAVTQPRLDLYGSTSQHQSLRPHGPPPSATALFAVTHAAIMQSMPCEKLLAQHISPWSTSAAAAAASTTGGDSEIDITASLNHGRSQQLALHSFSRSSSMLQNESVPPSLIGPTIIQPVHRGFFSATTSSSSFISSPGLCSQSSCIGSDQLPRQQQQQQPCNSCVIGSSSRQANDGNDSGYVRGQCIAAVSVPGLAQVSSSSIGQQTALQQMLCSGPLHQPLPSENLEGSVSQSSSSVWRPY